MARLTFRPYWPGDVALIDLRPEQEAEHRAMKASAAPLWADLSAMGGKAETALHGHRPVAAAGYYPVYGGRAVAWAFFSNMARRQWVQVRARLRARLAAAPFRRLEATARADFAHAVLFLESLGFTREGLLRAYVDGEDYYMMARVSDERL